MRIYRPSKAGVVRPRPRQATRTGGALVKVMNASTSTLAKVKPIRFTFR